MRELMPEDRDEDDVPVGSSTGANDDRTTLTETGQAQRKLEPEGAGQGAGAEGWSDPADENLIQLPIGAEFGMDHEPTAPEREDLVRFAAEANRELHGQDEAQDDDGAGRTASA
ncbi:hypothetical protein [Ornithinimicrobium tianjinense]|uniref:Uncharacterized protein n=1 Tax=Ornithinimicrobium tianjinense TaxID=1195761 RepID=A0A917BPZ4_9MICO|nr:hypothetical protein [Ornithinimicrobium tianjinense]GGF52583.1 hypothetical protein GCM10011366_20490 [Ornithinimicrobium tianjinense]